jgi:non-histone protein 10
MIDFKQSSSDESQHKTEDAPAPAPKKKKQPVDPNAPKRPANAFMLFCQLQREQVMKERQLRRESGIQDEETGNLTKELAARWKSLEKEEKESNFFMIHL